MLPWSFQARNNANEAKFADTGIRLLLKRMLADGASLKNIIAKLAGGAQMFTFSGASDMMRVGQRNVEAAKEILNSLKIPVISEDTGGNHGRTIELYSDDGRLKIKTIGYGIKYI